MSNFPEVVLHIDFGQTSAKNVAREALCFPTTSRILEYAFAMIVHLASKGSFFDIIVKKFDAFFYCGFGNKTYNRLWKYQQQPFQV
jgi:hypothetical protein